MKKNYRIIFNISSVLFLSFLVMFYGYRLFYYYCLEHKNYENSTINLYQKLIDNKGIDGTNEGLQTYDAGYIYGAKSNDNYLSYAGRLWRIISIDKNNNIKLITDEVQTLLNWNEADVFNDSNVNTWLNSSDVEFSGIFEKSLKNDERIVLQNNNRASLLTTKELELIGDNSFLAKKGSFWIIDSISNLPVVVNNDGKIDNISSNSSILGVRPTIVLNSTILYASGNGTIENPYIIENNVEKIIDCYVGNYVKYSNYIWKIIDVSDFGIKVVLNDSLDDNTTILYSNYDNEFTNYEGIGLYLNNTFYKTLINPEYIVPANYYIGSYNVNGMYDYLNTYLTEAYAYVGLPKIGDFFINDYPNIYTLTPYMNTTNTIYVINKNKNLYADFINNLYNIKPVIYLDSGLFIVDGNGTIESPYEVGK